MSPPGEGLPLGPSSGSRVTPWHSGSFACSASSHGPLKSSPSGDADLVGSGVGSSLGDVVTAGVGVGLPEPAANAVNPSAATTTTAPMMATIRIVFFIATSSVRPMFRSTCVCLQAR